MIPAAQTPERVTSLGNVLEIETVPQELVRLVTYSSVDLTRVRDIGFEIHAINSDLRNGPFDDMDVNVYKVTVNAKS